MKATEQYFPVVLFVMLYMMVLAFCHDMWRNMTCEHKSESSSYHAQYGENNKMSTYSTYSGLRKSWSLYCLSIAVNMNAFTERENNDSAG